MASTSRAQKRWVGSTRSRTQARREQVAAEAAAGAASLAASAISAITELGGEAVVHLRDGGLLAIRVPDMGDVAVIRAGQGWATAIVSPRVLGIPPPPAPAGANPEPMSSGVVRKYAPGAIMEQQGLAPAEFIRPAMQAIRAARPDWAEPKVIAEAGRLWDEMAVKP